MTLFLKSALEEEEEEEEGEGEQEREGKYQLSSQWKEEKKKGPNNLLCS